MSGWKAQFSRDEGNMSWAQEVQKIETQHCEIEEDGEEKDR